MPQNMYNFLIQDVLVNREKYANAYKSQPYSLPVGLLRNLFSFWSVQQHAEVGIYFIIFAWFTVRNNSPCIAVRWDSV
jgi:hypothetical protein